MVFPLTVVLAAAIVDPQQAPCELPCRIWLVNLGAVAAPGLGLGVRAAAGDGVFARSLGGTLIGFGAGTYLLGAPIVYWSRDLHERAFASLGLRLALPALGAVAGIAAGASGRSGDAASIGGHVYVGIEGGMSLTGPLPSDWSGGGAGGTVAIHAQLEGEHALAAITLLDGRAGQTCKTIPFEPLYPRCQAEGVVALDFKLGYAFGERTWAPYVALGPSYLTLTHSDSGDSSAGFAAAGEAGLLFFRSQRWGRAAVAATTRVPLFGSDYGSPAFTLVTVGLRLML